MTPKLFVNASELEFLPTAHVSGSKKTLFKGEDVSSELTQLAYGKLQAGEVIPEHSHATMEEFFYFTSGQGTYTIGDIEIPLQPGVAVRVPPATIHTLKANETLEFIYFGIAIH